jgi:hypothetical protein
MLFFCLRLEAATGGIMCVLAKDMAETVEITNGPFAGTYIFNGYTVYWLNGNKNTGQIHFTVNHTDYQTFVSFHITRDITGSNVAIWYNKGIRSEPQPFLPDGKKPIWKMWWDANKASCDNAATQFWNALNTCP